jgi:uncharacterized protein
LDYNLDTLYSFLRLDPYSTVTFYGGEPLLKTDIIRKIMDEAPAQRYMLQTNGLLLDHLEPEYMNRFATILISIDGPEALTDNHRGHGTYRKVMENVRKTIDNGFSGELIARMTVTESSDIFDAVTYLSNNPDYSFSSIHWQLDANFSNDFSHRAFASWVTEKYNIGIHSLIQHWVDIMHKESRVPRWYPFLDTMEDLLLKRTSLLRCGSGYANYSIMTDGNIAPCPIMIGMKDYYLGHIKSTAPSDLASISIGGECSGCQILNFCGGRCLYANIIQPWNLMERRLVCSTVENLYISLSKVLPEIRSLLDGGKITLNDFAHEKFNGCEIIP